MTWFAQSANETEAAGERWLSFLAVAFDFSSGVIRFWSGIGDLVIAGSTYLGAGELGSVSVATERGNLSVDKKSFRLSGVDPSTVSEADIDSSFGRSVTEYFGFINPNTHALVALPEINWEGEISDIRRVDGAEPLIEVNAEHRLVMLDRVDGWRYTHEHQQQFYAGDLGFNLVHTLDMKKVFWGGGPVEPGEGRRLRDPGGGRR